MIGIRMKTQHSTLPTWSIIALDTLSPVSFIRVQQYAGIWQLLQLITALDFTFWILPSSYTTKGRLYAAKTLLKSIFPLARCSFVY